MLHDLGAAYTCDSLRAAFKDAGTALSDTLAKGRHWPPKSREARILKRQADGIIRRRMKMGDRLSRMRCSAPKVANFVPDFSLTALPSGIYPFVQPMPVTQMNGCDACNLGQGMAEMGDTAVDIINAFKGAAVDLVPLFKPGTPTRPSPSGSTPSPSRSNVVPLVVGGAVVLGIAYLVFKKKR